MTNRPTRADAPARMAQHFERMNEPRRINPVGLVVVALGIVIAGAGAYGAMRAIGL